jgi:endonuclease YncB( thermonuclease family)
MNRVWFSVVLISAVLILAVVVYVLYKNAPLATGPAYTPPECVNSPLVVKRVIDGDTIQLCSGDIVRLLCVNTPEKGKGRYEEAKDFLEGLVLFEQVTLAASNYHGNNTDKYGRLLRWVYLMNGSADNLVQVNKLVFDQGYGELMIIPPEKCNEITD